MTEKFRPWAFKVATNTCLTFKVKNSRLRRGFVGQAKLKNEDGEEEPLEFPDDKVDLVRETEKNEIARRVQKALQKLPEKYRLALYLYYFEDLKYEEIAEDLGLPINTVRTQIKRGKEKMKEELRDLI